MYVYSITYLSPGWRADSARQHEETLNAVRATAQEQVPFNVQGVRPSPSHRGKPIFTDPS